MDDSGEFVGTIVVIAIGLLVLWYFHQQSVANQQLTTAANNETLNQKILSDQITPLDTTIGTGLGALTFGAINPTVVAHAASYTLINSSKPTSTVYKAEAGGQLTLGTVFLGAPGAVASLAEPQVKKVLGDLNPFNW